MSATAFIRARRLAEKKKEADLEGHKDQNEPGSPGNKKASGQEGEMRKDNASKRSKQPRNYPNKGKKSPGVEN
ncbi:hypothetical protein [Desulfosporosinus youngiae]|uniref:hypothetical protein n=1 Tax=Desulfosporosinus youngiae TaxID=339862 RepID=UPI0002F05255|nr:hypothetical protein [Desulfosporosinus youngiae]